MAAIITRKAITMAAIASKKWRILRVIIVCYLMMYMKRIRVKKQRRDALLRRRAFMMRIKMERRRRMINRYKN